MPVGKLAIVALGALAAAVAAGMSGGAAPSRNQFTPSEDDKKREALCAGALSIIPTATDANALERLAVALDGVQLFELAQTARRKAAELRAAEALRQARGVIDAPPGVDVPKLRATATMAINATDNADQLDMLAITLDNAGQADLAEQARQKARLIRAKQTAEKTPQDRPPGPVEPPTGSTAMPPPGTFDAHFDAAITAEARKFATEAIQFFQPDALDKMEAAWVKGQPQFPITRTNFPRRASQIRQFRATGNATPPEFIDPTGGGGTPPTQIVNMPPPGTFDMHFDPNLAPDLVDMTKKALAALEPDALDQLAPNFSNHPITQTNYPRRATQIRTWRANGNSTPPPFVDPTGGAPPQGQPPQDRPPTSEPVSFTFPVKSGDGGPMQIAKKLTGDGNKWREMLPLNPQYAAAMNKGILKGNEKLKLPPSWTTPDGRLAFGGPLDRNLIPSAVA
jgi:hypothetical protein